MEVNGAHWTPDVCRVSSGRTGKEAWERAQGGEEGNGGWAQDRGNIVRAEEKRKLVRVRGSEMRQWLGGGRR